MRALLLFGTALVLSWGLTWVMRLLAPRLGLVDRPRPDRWHRRPVPRLGGVAIYLAVTVPAVAARRGELETLAPVLAGGAAVFLAGLLDDLRRLENRPKLVLLIACAAVPVLLGVRFSALSAPVGVPLALLWVLGATNAFNWLDNMDGVAAGVAAIAAVYLVALARLTGRPPVGEVALLVAGACVGFLWHNFPPARVFMGDAGSGFLGLTLATLALLGSYRDVSNVLLTVLVPGLILAVPIFDSALVTVERLLHRRPLFQGGRDHPAHRLVTLGLPERRAVAVLYALSAAAGGAALLAVFVDLAGAAVLCAVLLLGFVALGVVLAEVRVYEGPGRAPERTTVLPRPFANKKWIAVMLLDVVLVSAAYVAAYLLRFDGHLPAGVVSALDRTLPLVVTAKIAAFYAGGVYRGTWRYVTAADLLRLGRAVTLASVLAAAAVAGVRPEGVSRGALVLDWVLAFLLVGGSRLSLRLLREYLAALGEAGRRTVIVGADAVGVLAARMLREDGSLGLRPVGFVDGEPARRGTTVFGLPVLGSVSDLEDIIRRYRIEEVVIAGRVPPSGLHDRVVAACAGWGVHVWTMEVGLRPVPSGPEPANPEPAGR